MTNINNEMLPYKVGGLLYTPALNEGIAEKIINHTYDCLTSIAFCLEDSIMDSALYDAEQTLIKTLEKLKTHSDECELPLIFVRVRNPEHLYHMSHLLDEHSNILTGYVLPKFDMSNAQEYIDVIKKLNIENKKIFAMPILESQMIANKSGRTKILLNIHQLLMEVKEYILNVRVGGNDFCNLYGLRRSANQTIYDIGVIRDILIDIINIFACDFVVSGVVWEYFGLKTDEDWDNGLRCELELDRLNGFIGKTAVHPSQLPVIYESLKVSADDYNDAMSILNWDSDNLGVGKSTEGSRMNEVKCHTQWAKKIKILGDIYGVKEVINEKFI